MVSASDCGVSEVISLRSCVLSVAAASVSCMAGNQCDSTHVRGARARVCVCVARMMMRMIDRSCRASFTGWPTTTAASCRALPSTTSRTTTTTTTTLPLAAVCTGDDDAARPGRLRKLYVSHTGPRGGADLPIGLRYGFVFHFLVVGSRGRLS